MIFWMIAISRTAGERWSRVFCVHRYHGFDDFHDAARWYRHSCSNSVIKIILQCTFVLWHCMCRHNRWLISTGIISPNSNNHSNASHDVPLILSTTGLAITVIALRRNPASELRVSLFAQRKRTPDRLSHTRRRIDLQLSRL
jgi:hypothetical protein